MDTQHGRVCLYAMRKGLVDMNTIIYVAIVLQAMFIVCALVEIKDVLLRILDELKKARKA